MGFSLFIYRFDLDFMALKNFSVQIGYFGNAETGIGAWHLNIKFSRLVLRGGRDQGS